jgi:hypothetical protein
MDPVLCAEISAGGHRRHTQKPEVLDIGRMESEHVELEFVEEF